jgi:hypothetical protein
MEGQVAGGGEQVAADSEHETGKSECESGLES